MFSGYDAACTHTLAGAVASLLTDLVEHHLPGSTWEEMVQKDNNLAPREYFKLAPRAQNFMKHARDDPTDTLEFNPSDTEALLTIAVLGMFGRQ